MLTITGNEFAFLTGNHRLRADVGCACAGCETILRTGRSRYGPLRPAELELTSFPRAVHGQHPDRTEPSPAVDANAESHRVNCGPLMIDPLTEEPLPNQIKAFSATVTESQSTTNAVTTEIEIEIAPALEAPTRPYYHPYPHYALVHWSGVVGAGSQSERFESIRGTTYAAYFVRYRASGTQDWTYAVQDYSSYGGPAQWEEPGAGVHELEVAAIRHPLEAESPSALNWSQRLRYAHGAPIENAAVTATVDAVTVRWDAQPHAGEGFITIESANGRRVELFIEPDQAGTHLHVFSHVEPDTEYTITIEKVWEEGLATIECPDAPTCTRMDGAASGGAKPPPLFLTGLVDVSRSTGTSLIRMPIRTTASQWSKSRLISSSTLRTFEMVQPPISLAVATRIETSNLHAVTPSKSSTWASGWVLPQFRFRRRPR